MTDNITSEPTPETAMRPQKHPNGVQHTLGQGNLLSPPETLTDAPRGGSATTLESQQRKITNPKTITLLLVSAIIGGISGALLLGHILEHIARAIFALEPFNLTSTLTLSSIMVLLTAVGTLTLVAALWVENKKARWWIMAFSMPIPIVIEIVDLIIRFVHVINDATIFYGLA